MTAKIKLLIVALVNICVNGGLWVVVPDQYKLLTIAVINLAQVIYAFYDPTYMIEAIKMGKLVRGQKFGKLG